MSTQTTQNLLNLLDALEKYGEAKRVHDKARDKCEWDWGYFGHEEMSDVNNAMEFFGKCLEDFIDARVRRILPEVKRTLLEEEMY